VRILAAMFQDGGNIHLLMPIMTRLVERGHQLRIIAGPGIRRSRLPIRRQFLERLVDSGAVADPPAAV